MSVREQLSLEHQFELKAFEQKVKQLSHEDAQTLLVQLKELMLFQNASFSEILREAWGIG
ncbi:phycobilisome degradation protein nbla [Leptolyngbya sp. Heron Island J]|uniref:NblA/ycf18 family protein n=1 Tax=Leptolyngbya sp. Heron Island J TaxID=1385935 RepID=UPI0003B98883|nr:NblA/ycf18 family protein [Leptolyngbya sp. Heron Island J]ESA36511.1 phycobilisome degradation protein nbla [Leptolyngbya sp. Heron Island J]